MMLNIRFGCWLFQCGKTPLTCALEEFGHTDIARLLIDKGADVNSRENDGYTPLIWASNRGHTDIARLLIDKGADVNSKDKDGTTPLISASEFGHTEIVRFLIEKGADVNCHTEVV
eukprot:GHVR01182052.1.p1 GENE.GHVR01182052.1~~GHVR01182052.1.p1  ORF type:complete len:116 (+),score=15.91 GHVR01182052.1:30-377(+)